MKRRFLSAFAIHFFSVIMAGVALADPFDILNSRFSGTSQSLRAAAYGNGAYVAVGDNGTILYSTDTVTWIPKVSGTTNGLYGVKYGTNGFVAVGSSISGAGTILSSPDGITWTAQTSPVTNKLSAICYASGRYVVVGSQGMIISSTNAVNWTKINTGVPYDLNGVDGGSVLASGYITPLFVAVGNSGTIMTSPDGLAWTLRFSGTFFNLAAASIVLKAYNADGDWIGSTLVAVGDSGTILTSTDYTSWTSYSSGTSSNLLGVANDGNGRFGAIGQEGTFVAAPDGINWAAEPMAGSTDLNGLIYANGNFLAVGNSGAIQAGVAWLPRNSGTTSSFVAGSYGNGTYVVLGGQTLVASADGINWSVGYANGSANLSGITFGTNLFVAVGGRGTGMVLTSSNGFNWVSQNLGVTNSLSVVAYGDGVFVAMGSAGVVFRSPDGVNWTYSYPSLPFSSYPSITSIVFGNNLFAAMAGNQTVATSPDGLTWTTRVTGGGNVNARVGFGGGLFVSVGAYSGGAGTFLMQSPDGTNWTATSSGEATDYGIAYGNLGFIAPGLINAHSNSISTTLDGVNWTERGIGGDLFANSLNGATFGNNSYLVVGANGRILQSTPTNAQAIPLISCSPTNAAFTISAIAQPGYTYHIQISTNLLNWTNEFNFASTQTVTSFIDTGAITNPVRFYRITTP